MNRIKLIRPGEAGRISPAQKTLQVGTLRLMSAITVEHLIKRVPNSGGLLTILDDVSFSVATGETVAIVGASGSGKSTLLGLLAGLDLPTQGRVIALGQDLFALDEEGRAAWRAHHVGLCFSRFSSCRT